jgi:hypothetical protein
MLLRLPAGGPGDLQGWRGPIRPDLGLDWAAETFGSGWAWGFLDAFDGRTSALADPGYLHGYRQGALAAQEALAGGGAPGS